MLISQSISRCLTNHSELCMSRLLNNQPRRISIYRRQWRPSFGFESSVSSTPMTSGDPVLCATFTVVGAVFNTWAVALTITSFLIHFPLFNDALLLIPANCRENVGSLLS